MMMVVVEIFGPGCRIFRSIGTGIAFISLLDIALHMCCIDSEKSIASPFLFLGDVACSQRSVVEWSHVGICCGVISFCVGTIRVVVATMMVTDVTTIVI